MIDSLVTKFRLAKDALTTAVAGDYNAAIRYFDQQMVETFEEILQAAPTDRTSRYSLCEFLLDFCGATCSGESTNRAARRRIIELI